MLSNRDKEKGMMLSVLGGVDNPEIATLVRHVERSCWNEAIARTSKGSGVLPAVNDVALNHHYSNLVYLLTGAIEEDEHLRDRLIKDPQTARICASMTLEELVPDKFAAERELLKVKSEQKVEQKVSTRFACRKCGHRGATILEAQTRGTDEMPSFSHKCMNCGFIWG
jgi:DNA-directed RNA polymerase subunit M/transcription elongation factor TFIIS